MLALIIDDSRVMRSILRRTMTGLGWSCVEAGDGREALTLLEDGLNPDLCLVDWYMPVMDGITLLQQVRRRPEWRSTVMMMVTSEAETTKIVRALAAGAHEYLVKPFTPDAVLEKLTLLGLPGHVAPTVPPSRTPLPLHRALPTTDEVPA